MSSSHFTHCMSNYAFILHSGHIQISPEGVSLRPTHWRWNHSWCKKVMGLCNFAHTLNLLIFCSFLFSCILYHMQVLHVIAFVLEFCPYEHIFERLYFCVRYCWWFWENKVGLHFELCASLIGLMFGKCCLYH